MLSAADWSGANWIASPAKKIDTSKWTDYRVEVEFSLQREALGVFLRATSDTQNAYMYQINATGNSPILKAHKKVKGSYEELARIDLGEFGFSNASLLQGKHLLIFDVRGSTVTTTLDGKQIETRRDSTFSDGVIGFRTFGAESGTIHRVRVVGANGNILMAPDFSKGQSGLTGGTVSGGAYQISGGTEAIYTGENSSLPLLRRSFRAKSQVQSARLYASARGLYEFSLNGKKVSDQFLAPGWTDYNKRLQSQTYDVTTLHLA